MIFVNYLCDFKYYNMEYIAKILDSLKENEKTIIISIIANALIIYLICFTGIKEFQTFQWYQQLIIPFSISICFLSSFYVTTAAIYGIINIFLPVREIFYSLMNSNLLGYSSIFCIGNLFTLIEITNTLIDKFHCFSLSYILKGMFFYYLGFCFSIISLGVSIYIKELKSKK